MIWGFSSLDGLRDDRVENFDQFRDLLAQPGVQLAFSESKFGDYQPAASFRRLLQAGPYLVDEFVGTGTGIGFFAVCSQ